MDLQVNTLKIQSDLATYCRTGKEVDIPGITSNRLDNYRRLILSIFEDNLASSFPIANQYLPEDIWKKMVQLFIKNHACQSYQSWKIPGEFYHFVVKEKFQDVFVISYLNDLLKFEWEELLMYNMEDIKPKESHSNGDLLNNFLVFNPEFKLVQLQYPVHLFNPLKAQEKKGNYYALMYRENDSGSIQFFDVSVWFALLIEQLSTNKITLRDLLKEAPILFGNIDLKELESLTIQFLETLVEKKFILGFSN